METMSMVPLESMSMMEEAENEERAKEAPPEPLFKGDVDGSTIGDATSKSLPPARGILARQAVHVAKYPCTYFWVFLIISLALSVVGIVVGDFGVAVDNAGWNSRGTLISDRQSQFLVVQLNQNALFTDKAGASWDELINNVQPGWETDDDGVVAESDVRRSMLATTEKVYLGELLDRARRLDLQRYMGSPWDLDDQEERRLPLKMTPSLERKLQLANTSSLLDGCDVSWYTGAMMQDKHLWPIWRPKAVAEPNTLLREDVLRDLCRSEEKTQKTLVDKGLCYGCSDATRCLPPYSIVFFARLTIANGFELSCEQLAAAWVVYNAENKQFEQNIVQCTKDLQIASVEVIPDSCPQYFSPILIDERYSSTNVVAYTSSIFASKNGDDEILDLFENRGRFSRGTNLIEGVYDTRNEDFVTIQIDNSLVSDMSLAMGSALGAYKSMNRSL
jgi:hypothetical protein